MRYLWLQGGLLQHSTHHTAPHGTSLVCQEGLLCVRDMPEQHPGVLVAGHHLQEASLDVDRGGRKGGKGGKGGRGGGRGGWGGGLRGGGGCCRSHTNAESPKGSSVASKVTVMPALNRNPFESVMCVR